MIKRVLITGGAGYVGAVLVPKLLKKGYKVKVLDWYIFGKDVFSEFKSDNNLVEIKGDIRDKKLLERELKDVDAVIHLACISNDPSFELDKKLGKSVNYDATIQLTDLAKKSGVKRFIYASTSSVYGIKKEKEVTEDLPLESLTDYSKYKAMCEEYLLRGQVSNIRHKEITPPTLPLKLRGGRGELPVVLILRPATVCGYSPRLRLDLTVNMLTLQALVSKKIRVFGGNQMRPNIHIEDMTDLYVKTLEYPSELIDGKIYNAGYENYSILEIAQMIKRVLKDPEIEINILPTDDKRSYHISSKKIAKELGFIPKRSVEDAILDLKNAYNEGKIKNPMTDKRYYNIKTMQGLRQV